MFEALAKYNFWDNRQRLEVGFNRVQYLGLLTGFLGNRLVKVILGQRRTGKSYILRLLLRQLMEELGVPPANIFYVNMDIQAMGFIRDEQVLLSLLDEYRQRLRPEGKVYIFLDEVQEISGWEKAVNSLSQDYTAEYEIFITGSNSNLLSSELATYLSGRFVTLEVFPFSYAEYLGFFKVGRGSASFADYLSLGGLPELYHLENPEIRHNYLANLRDSIVLRDIVQRHQVRDAALLNRLLDFMTDSHGAMISPNKICHTLNSLGHKTNLETIIAYLGFLREAYFLHEVQRYEVKGRRLLAGERKYYLNDLAFKTILMSGGNPAIGRLLENAMFLHFRRQGWQVHTGRIGSAEVDFVLRRADQVKYVQVCYLLADDQITRREFGNLELINDNYEKLVVSMDAVSLGNVRGIKHVQAWEL